MNKQITDEILDEMPDNTKDDPLIRENGRLYLKYDQIILNIEQDQVLLKFCYRGDVLYENMIPTPIQTGNSIDLTGIDGRVELKRM